MPFFHLLYFCLLCHRLIDHICVDLSVLTILFHWSVFKPVSYCFYYYSFVIESEVSQFDIMSFSFFFFLRLLWPFRVFCSSMRARRSKQSILREINPGYSLEGLMLKLKLQYFGHVMWRADSLEKILMLGKIEGRRRRGTEDEMLDDITDSMNMSLNKLREIMKDKEA